jgi:hypothetical protein
MEKGAKRRWKAGRPELAEGEKPVLVSINLTAAQHAALKKTGKMGTTIRQLVDRWMKRREKS